MNTEQQLPQTIDEYIAGLAPEIQEILESIRRAIKQAAPDAAETISYQMPTFTLYGNLVHFAAFKTHIGFYPTPSGIEAFKDELSVYAGGKGSVKFPLDKPVPLDLIRRIVEFRVRENLAKAETKARRKHAKRVANPHQHVPQIEASVVIKPFGWADWYAMWKLQAYHLAEHGIIIDDADQGPPDLTLPYDESNPNYYEMDMERIDEAYLKGKGNFWLAWLGDQPVGMVGGQDMGDYIELRRMYVRAEYRRRGIGAALVQALIEHCQQQKTSRVKLWTADDGPGRFLYARCGFRQVALAGDEINHERAIQGEIRMCLEMREDNAD